MDVTALEWGAGATAVSHKVYLSSDETIDDADLLGETNLTLQVAILDPGATYYWRVDEIDADGNLFEGNVWSFTTLPLEAHFPSPADGAKSRALDSKLSWTGGKNSIMHNVYFGTDPAMLLPVSMMQMPKSYDPGALDAETTYYWKVDEFTPAGTIAGPVWSFTTLGAVPITDPDLLLYYDFETPAGAMVIDQSGHSNHGQFNGTPELVGGLFGTAVSIVSEDVDYIQTAGSLGITSNNITVTGWVYHDESPAAWSGILTTRGSGNLGLQHDGSELRYMWGADEYWWVETGLQIPNGEWYFAALTISPDQGKLYLNGVDQTLTNVAPHVPVAFDSQVRVGRDHQDSRIMTSLIDEVRLYDKTLTDVEIQALAKPHVADVTAPGDVVKGVPDEPRDGDIAGWPDGEYPLLAVDDDVSTKFLHFRGEVSPTGFVVEPAMGATVVTGLTLTTANDSAERDPASFELSGSNESIDGPYELIAAGDVVDFIQEAELPRFTMNATPITFENAVAYKYYQVMFPAVRDAGSANSMQIAEVELLGVPAPVAHWTFDDGAGTVALDSSGNASDGILMGDPQWVPGARGGALEFDGIDDYVDCGNPAVLDITGDITLMAWIKVAAFTKTWETILGKGDDSYRMSRGPGDGDSIHFGANGTGDNLNASTVVTTNTWRHVALVYNGASKTIYIDGVEDARDASSGNINSSGYNFYVGQNSQQADRYLTGLVDDVRIYNKALSPLQIRELAVAPKATVAWVSYHGADDEPHADAAGVGFTMAPDIEYTDLLKANGYNVMRVLTSQDPDVDLLNMADLVIISRTASSGHYSGSGASLWNSVTAPMINLNGYTLRSSRLGFTDGTDMPDSIGDITLTVLDPNHPIFAGVELLDGTMVNPYAEGAVPLPTDPTILSRGISVNNNNLDEEGIVLATVATVDDPTVGGIVIAELPAGATLQNSSGSPDDVLGGPRLVFLTGSREPSGVTGGQAAALYDLYADGEQMFLNAVDYMIQPVNILFNGGLEDDASGAGWGTYGDVSMEVVQDLAGAAIADVPIEGSSCLHVTVNSAGANFWDAGLQHGGHVFEGGKSYTLSVWFKSQAGPFQINIKPERAADPWDGFGSQEITITEEWDVYTVNTGVIADAVDPASITFHIAYAPGEFWVDNAVFTED